MIIKKALVITAVIVGFLLALQIRSYREVKLIFERSEPQEILSELRVLQVANQQLRDNLGEAEAVLENTRSKIAQEAIEEKINRLRLLSGTEAVAGEGIDITLSSVAKAYWLSDLIAQLVSAGAEAIAINDIRLTARTAGFRSVSGGLLMHDRFLRPPLRITAIGPSERLQKAIAPQGGIIDRMENSEKGLTILLAKRDTIIIPALTE